MLPEEIRARNGLLQEDPRSFLDAPHEKRRARNDKDLLVGRHSAEVRKTFERAELVLSSVQEKYPKIDRDLILECLKEQTIIAETSRTPQDRKKTAAWKRLCKAWIEFCATANQTPTLEALKDVQKSQERQGHTTHDPRDLWRKWYKKWPPFFQDLQATHDLPAPEAIGNKGRPSSWWSDVQVGKLADHFRGKTGKPQWKLVSALLECAPPIPGVKMSALHIRQRLSKSVQDKQELLMMRFTGTRER